MKKKPKSPTPDAFTAALNMIVHQVCDICMDRGWYLGYAGKARCPRRCVMR